MTVVETYLFLGNRARVLLDANATGGLFGLIEFTEAVGSRTPPHLHARDTEIIYVLAGRTRVETEGEAFDLLPGTAHVLPPGRSHRLSIPEVETRQLVLVTPGAFVDFVRAVGIAADASTPLRHTTADKIARVRDVAGAYGIELLPEDSLQAAKARLNQQQAPGREKNEEAARSTELSFAVADRQITLERSEVPPSSRIPLALSKYKAVYIIEGQVEAEFSAPSELHTFGSGDAVMTQEESCTSLLNANITKTASVLLISESDANSS